MVISDQLIFGQHGAVRIVRKLHASEKNMFYSIEKRGPLEGLSNRGYLMRGYLTVLFSIFAGSAFTRRLEA